VSPLYLSPTALIGDDIIVDDIIVISDSSSDSIEEMLSIDSLLPQNQHRLCHQHRRRLWALPSKFRLLLQCLYRQNYQYHTRTITHHLNTHHLILKLHATESSTLNVGFW